jgi:hypothetical protein
MAPTSRTFFAAAQQRSTGCTWFAGSVLIGGHWTAGPARLCRGTLLSWQQYLVDVEEWGFEDARLEERVQMNEKDIADWTGAIEKQQ